jgi:prepilin-type N-terminal cleavage/methylation domain-containing protein
MKIVKTKTGGFTLVEIMIVVAIIGLLAAIAIPNFMNARKTAQKTACINNLQQIESAAQQWAREQKEGLGRVHAGGRKAIHQARFQEGIAGMSGRRSLYSWRHPGGSPDLFAGRNLGA